jgi:hypothetical protein
MTNISIPWSSLSAKHLARLPARQAWQAPTFLFGVASFAIVLTLRPLWHNTDAVEVQHKLTEAYALLEDPKSSNDEICRLANDVLAHRCSTQEAARAHLMLGVALARIAGQTTGPTAEQAYQHAREELEQANSPDLPQADQPRLHFQLGQCYFHLNEAPEKIIEQLAAGLPLGADNKPEGYAQLAEQCRQVKDIDGALKAYNDLLQLPQVPDTFFWTANLNSGELLLQKNDITGARRALEKIKPPAPIKELRKARSLLAQGYQTEGQWELAAAQWKLLLDHSESKQELGRALCNLGVCFHELKRDDDARAAWEEALQTAGAVDVQAAALGLAELKLDADPAAAVTLFQRAAAKVENADQWVNTLVDLSSAQQRYESACRRCLERGRFEAALQIAQIYVKLAPPGRGHELAAQAAQQWAESLKDADREKAYLTAGTEFEAAAAAAIDHDKAERFWSALQCYLQAKSSASVARVANLLARTGQMPEKVAEGWYRLAELQLATIPAGASDSDAAVYRDKAMEAYRQCLNYPGKFQYRARYHLAHEKIAQGDFDHAIEDLNTNLALLAVDKDREAHENSAFELADILFQRQLYRQALGTLTPTLELYHEGSRALRAQYQVAECHRLLAEEAQNSLRDTDHLLPEQQEYYRKQRQESYQTAYESYQKLAENLDAERASHSALTEQDQSLYRAARFKEAECRFQAGDYQGALAVNLELSTLYDRQVEKLHALAGKRRCYFALSETDKAVAVLDEIKRTLDGLSESSFNENASPWNKQKWTDWLEAERRNDHQAGLRNPPRVPPVK